MNEEECKNIELQYKRHKIEVEGRQIHSNKLEEIIISFNKKLKETTSLQEQQIIHNIINEQQRILRINNTILNDRLKKLEKIKQEAEKYNCIL